jgi:hypothetical protein
MDWLVLMTLWLPCQRRRLLVWQYPGWNWRAIVAMIEEMKLVMIKYGPSDVDVAGIG